MPSALTYELLTLSLTLTLCGTDAVDVSSCYFTLSYVENVPPKCDHLEYFDPGGTMRLALVPFHAGTKQRPPLTDLLLHKKCGIRRHATPGTVCLQTWQKNFGSSPIFEAG